MRLVDDARRAWRWFSVQAFVLAGAIQLTWAELPADLKATIPPDWVMYTTAAICALGVVGRLVAQPKAGVE